MIHMEYYLIVSTIMMFAGIYGFVTRSEDIDLLRIWIEKGCPQN